MGLWVEGGEENWKWTKCTVHTVPGQQRENRAVLSILHILTKLQNQREVLYSVCVELSSSALEQQRLLRGENYKPISRGCVWWKSRTNCFAYQALMQSSMLKKTESTILLVCYFVSTSWARIYDLKRTDLTYSQIDILVNVITKFTIKTLLWCCTVCRDKFQYELPYFIFSKYSFLTGIKEILIETFL